MKNVDTSIDRNINIKIRSVFEEDFHGVVKCECFLDFCYESLMGGFGNCRWEISDSILVNIE